MGGKEKKDVILMAIDAEIEFYIDQINEVALFNRS